MGELTPQTLFPTKDSLRDATESIHAQLPITTTNDLHTALMTYQNTLLHELERSFHVDAKTLGHLESFKMVPAEGHESEFDAQRAAYNQAISHVVAYFTNRMS